MSGVCLLYHICMEVSSQDNEYGLHIFHAVIVTLYCPAPCLAPPAEVGMQNSTLGAVLATLHFADPLTAAPCAVSACTHSVLGSMLAAYWRSQDDKASATAGPPSAAAGR